MKKNECTVYRTTLKLFTNSIIELDWDVSVFFPLPSLCLLLSSVSLDLHPRLMVFRQGGVSDESQ